METKDQDRAQEFAHIKGWGIDADRKNDPTYPMKSRKHGEQHGRTWERPAQQPEQIETLHSSERPDVTAVFGTSVPPSGLSGVLRRFAFDHGESSYAHWLPLMLADRINMVEGVVDDIRHGHFPNVLEERGVRMDWKHQRETLLAKSIIAGILASTAFGILWARRASH